MIVSLSDAYRYGIQTGHGGHRQGEALEVFDQGAGLGTFIQPTPQAQNVGGWRSQAPFGQELQERALAQAAVQVVVQQGLGSLPQQAGVRWKAPTLVLFDGVTNSACGTAQSAMGPFYCPLDRKIYLDTDFFRDMQRNFGGGGDFAYAYVISHEMGHHIENLLGILPKVQSAQARAGSRAQANNLSVRVELMADCFAGVWAHHADRKWRVLEQGDVEKAIATATAIGDDRLQRASQGQVVPDSFTHGSSAQRVQWLQRGLKSGQMDSCNTFANSNNNTNTSR